MYGEVYGKVYGVLRGIRGIRGVTSSDDSVGDVVRDLFRVYLESLGKFVE